MKNLITALCILAIFVVSCSKKKELAEEISKQEILNNKIKDIIPVQYLDSLKKLGMEVNSNFTPPNIEGTYAIAPMVLKNTSVPNDNKIGTRYLDGKVQFNSQKSDFSINLLGQHLVRNRDTSIVTAIAGSGNDFTIYGKVRSTIGTNSAIFAIIISGVKDGAAIKNYKMGIINIDDSNGGGNFVIQGRARVAEDQDGISESIDPNTFSSNLRDSGIGM